MSGEYIQNGSLAKIMHREKKCFIVIIDLL